MNILLGNGASKSLFESFLPLFGSVHSHARRKSLMFLLTDIQPLSVNHPSERLIRECRQLLNDMLACEPRSLLLVHVRSKLFLFTRARYDGTDLPYLFSLIRINSLPSKLRDLVLKSSSI